MSFVWYCKDGEDADFNQENLSDEPVVSEHDFNETALANYNAVRNLFIFSTMLLLNIVCHAESSVQVDCNTDHILYRFFNSLDALVQVVVALIHQILLLFSIPKKWWKIKRKLL